MTHLEAAQKLDAAGERLQRAVNAVASAGREVHDELRAGLTPFQVPTRWVDRVLEENGLTQALEEWTAASQAFGDAVQDFARTQDQEAK